MIEELHKGRSVEDFIAPRNMELSPVADTALQVLAESQETQQHLFEKLWGGKENVAYAPSLDVFERGLDALDKRLYFISNSALVFASSIPEIEASMVNGYFSIEDYYATRNNYITGTLQTPWIIPNATKIEAIDDERRSRMLNIIKEDPSFALLYNEENKRILPKSVQGRLNAVAFYQGFGRLITDAFREVVALRR